MCGVSSSSPSGPINVDCSAAGGDVQTVVCNYDNGAIIEDCELKNTFTRLYKLSISFAQALLILTLILGGSGQVTTS